MVIHAAKNAYRISMEVQEFGSATYGKAPTWYLIIFLPKPYQEQQSYGSSG
jgi:hypothetical protein